LGATRGCCSRSGCRCRCRRPTRCAAGASRWRRQS
jgi:hypothetical protein